MTTETKDSLALEISKLLVAREPRLINADLKATAEVVAKLADVIGCLMAAVKIKEPMSYDLAIELVVQRIRDSSDRVTEGAKMYAEAKDGKVTLQ